MLVFAAFTAPIPAASQPLDASQVTDVPAILPALLELLLDAERSPDLVGGADGRTPGAGRVRFFNLATSSFDRWSFDPDAEARAWMQDNYAGMLTYPPYFNSRLTWYPKAWGYLNTTGILVGSSRARDHPEWLLRDASGRALFIPFDCEGETCSRYAADVGHPAFREHFVARARTRIAPGYAGLWLDDVNLTWRTSDGTGRHVRAIDPRTGEPMALRDWQRYLAELLEAVRVALPDAVLAHNVVWYSDDGGEPFIDRALQAADFVNLERGVNDAGLTAAGRFSLDRFFAFVDRVHAHDRAVVLMDYGRGDVQREYGLAGHLLVNASRDMYSNNDRAWTTPDSFWHGYQLDLGPALGARYRWQGLLRRDFACGIVLLNGPSAAPVDTVLPRKLLDVDGVLRERVELGAREARILRDACACSGPDCDKG